MSAGRRRVLFLIPTLTGGGAERVMVTLLQHLDRSRFELILAVVDTRNAVFRSEVPADVNFIDLDCHRVRNALPKIVQLVWRLRPDVLMSTLGHLNLGLSIIRPLLPNKTWYVARESAVVSHAIAEYARPTWWAWAYRRFYSRFDRVICQSLDMRDDLVHRFAIGLQQAVVINNPIDVERIASAIKHGEHVNAPGSADKDSMRHRIQLIAAGRLVEQKGFDLLIEAMALARNQDLFLTILGDGPLREELVALAESRGLGERVRFVGFQRNPYILIARADLFVLSSRYEGFPNVVLEALACGTPVVALPAPGGVNEILASVDGCVVAGDMTAAALAAALDRWTPSRISLTAVDAYAVARIVELYAAELGRQTVGASHKGES